MASKGMLKYYCKKLDAGVGPLSVSADVDVDAMKTFTFYVYGGDDISGVAELSKINWVPAFSDTAEYSFTYLKEAGVYTCQIQLPEFRSSLNFHIKIQDASSKEWFSCRMGFSVGDESVCVLCMNAQDRPSSLYPAIFRAMSTVATRDTPAPSVWRRLLAHHAQMLLAGIEPNFNDACLEIYNTFYKVNIVGANKTETVLWFWSLIGQVLEFCSTEPVGDTVTVEVLAALFDVANVVTHSETLTAWFTQQEPAAELAKRACKWLFELDRQSPVSSFRFTLLFEILSGLKDSSVKTSLGVGIPPATFHAQNPLPDFKAPATKDEKATAAKLLSNTAAFSWGNLERSETLAERDDDYMKAVKSAETVLQRHWTAKVSLRDEKKYAQKMVSTICKLSQRANSEGVPGWDQLSEGHRKAVEHLNNAEAEVLSLETLDLAESSRELATKGKHLQEQTKHLVTDFGPYVGSKQQFTVSTLVGFSLTRKVASVDGPSKDNKGVPIAHCQPTDAVSLPNRGIVFTEQGSGRIRYTNRQGYTRTLADKLRRPGGIIKVGEDAYVFAENGTGLIKRLAYAPLPPREREHGQRDREDEEPEYAWQVATVGGAGVTNRITDGSLATFQFTNISQMIQVNYKEGPVVLIADSGRIRMLTGSFISGRITTLTIQAPAYRDGMASKGATAAVNGMTFDENSQRLYFTDARAVRCLDMSEPTKMKLSTLHSDTSRLHGIALIRVPDEERPSEMLPALIVTNPAQNIIKLLVLNRQKASIISNTTVLGRSSTLGGWKDGNESTSAFHTPGTLVASQDGSFLLLEPMRIRLVAPPLTLEAAQRMYGKLQVQVEELTENIYKASRESNVQSSAIIDGIRNARGCIAHARAVSQEASYKEYAAEVLNRKHPSILGLVAIAPNVQLLRWVTAKVLESGMFTLDDFATQGSHSFEMDCDIPYSVSSLTPRPFGIRDAVDQTVKQFQWSTSASEQEKTVNDLISFSREHETLLGPDTLEKALKGVGFKAPPHKALLTLVSDLFFIDYNSTTDDEYTPELLSAIESWFTNSVPRESVKEHLSREKLIRGFILIWDSAFIHLQTELQTCSDKEKKVLNATARKLAKWTLLSILQSGSKRQFESEAYFSRLMTGITTIFEQDSEVELCPEMMSILEWSCEDSLLQVPFGDMFELVFAAEPDTTVVKYQQDFYLLHTTAAKLLEPIFEKQVVDGNTEYTITQVSLLAKAHRDRWPSLLQWYSDQLGNNAQYCTSKGWMLLKQFVKAVGVSFIAIHNDISTGSITTQSFSRIVPIKSCVVSSWKALKLQPTDVMTSAANRLFKCKSMVTQIEEVVAHFLKESDEAKLITDSHKLGSYSLTELEHLLQITSSDEAGDDVPRLSLGFRSGIPILTALYRNPIFYFMIWSDLTKTHRDDVPIIEKAVTAWKDLCGSLFDGTATFSTLGKMCEVTQNPPDVGIRFESESVALVTLCESHSALQKPVSDGEEMIYDDDGYFPTKYTLPVTLTDNTSYQTASTTLASFQRFLRVSKYGEEINKNLDLLLSLVRSAGKNQVRTAQQKLLSLEAEVKLLDFDSLTVSDMDRLGSTFKEIDDRLITMSSKLLHSVKDHFDFLEWLCEFSDDSNFTSSVEMSMGKPEMECPPELWVSEATGTGHPDESKLSQLTGIRSALHKLLYSGSSLVRDSLQEVLDCLGNMPRDKAEATAESIDELSPLKLPFAELLSSDGEASSLNRLLNLQLESWGAYWELSTTQETPSVELWLNYSVVRDTKKTNARQCVSELLDFQSAIVLAKSRSEESTMAVQTFVAQFGWVRELVIQYEALKRAGHPSRQSFTESIPLTKSPEDLQHSVSSTKAEIASWESSIVKLRNRFPSLNTLSLKQLLRLHAAHSSSSTSKEQNDSQLTQSVISEIHNSLFPSAPIVEAREVLADVWGGGSSGNLSAADFISKTDELMNVYPKEWSTFPQRSLNFADSSMNAIEKGVSLIVCEGQSDVYKTFLSHHIRCGCLPSWNTTLWVSEETTFEQISNFILLWGLQKSSQRTLYCLVGVDAIGDSYQKKVASLILEYSSTTDNQLTVVSASRNHYVVRQLSHWRTSFALLDVDDLQRLGISLSNEIKSCPVTTYTSEHAGAGKTFAIHADASAGGAERTVVTVPIHRFMTSGELITLIESRKRATNITDRTPWVLHLDLSDQISETSSIRLFELITLRSLYDGVTGRRWFLPNVPLFIEVAPGLKDKLPVITYLQSKNVVATSESFCSSMELLSKGGMEDAALAISSLVRLVQIIKCSDHHRGIPNQYSPHPDDLCTGEVPDNAFNIVCRTANLQHPVSLWSFWAFVMISSKLVADTFKTDSPLMEKFRPISNGDALKGETLDFICRTASDFATRQKRGLPMDSLCVLRLDNMGYAIKAQFRSEGQPVFKMGNRFDPTFIYFKDGAWRMGRSLESSTASAGAGAPLTSTWQLTHDSVMTVALLTLAQAKRESPSTYQKVVEEDALVPVEEGPLGDLKTWGEANHEALLVSSASDSVHVLSLNKVALVKRMHPGLLDRFIDWNMISLYKKESAATHVQTISSLTAIKRSPSEAAFLLGSNYCLTQDIVLKMTAVLIRIKSSIPVVLMGECGCGKTHMLRYISAWLGVQLKILDVHGGTTEQDILTVFKDAREICEKSAKKEKVFVFLDEVNTCAFMSLITEAIVSRTLNGEPIHENIRILSACNPYRKRFQTSYATPGLSYTAPTRSDVVRSELDDLVYRVHPIPLRLQEYIFDFGSLSPDIEAKYIHEMVAKTIPDQNTVKVVTELLIVSQNFIREVEGDPSVVSLRDLRKALQLAKWFKKFGAKAVAGRDAWSAPTILAIAHVFYFRLSSSEDRERLLSKLSLSLRERADATFDCSGWSWLRGTQMVKLIKQTMNALCSKLEVEEGIAMNQALQENLYVTMICIFNKIPVFVVGKPGSSKTLTLQVLANNLKGDQSTSDYWKRFPALYIFPYQCSPLSTAAGIKHQFDIACNYQTKAQKTIVILLLDEVGLAEHSPDMPLKVLHGILVKPPIAIVGLSNWTLDAAKMNRAVCLKRCEPEESDIELTGKEIIGGMFSKSGLLQKLSQAYHKVYFNQPGREFIGMRDYYQMLKLLRREQQRMDRKTCLDTCRVFLTNSTDKFKSKFVTAMEVTNDSVRIVEGEEPIPKYEFLQMITEGQLIPFSTITPSQIDKYSTAYDPSSTTNNSPFIHPMTDEAIDQTKQLLQGHKDIKNLVMYSLLRNFGGHPTLIKTVMQTFAKECFKQEGSVQLSAPELIRSNLCDINARHLMILTKHGAALPLLFSSDLIDASTTEVLVGNSFKDDAHELHLIQQVNRVKAAMARGGTVILHNQDSIYESLYDVLNQRYVTRTARETGKVHKMLRLAVGARSQLCPVQEGFRIIVVAEQDHAYENLDLPLLNRFEKQVLTFQDCLSEEQLEMLGKLEKWVESVLSETNFSILSQVFGGFHKDTLSSLIFSHTNLSEEELKMKLADIASPTSVMQSHTLSTTAPDYSSTHEGLHSCLAYIDKEYKVPPLGVVITNSSAEQLNSMKDPTWGIITLAELTTERAFLRAFTQLLSSTSKTIIVQCDPLTSAQSTIDHARHIVEMQVSPANDKQIIFLIHMPPGARDRVREYKLNFLTNWVNIFVDDIRSDDGGQTASLLRHSLFDLIQQNKIDLMDYARKKFSTAMSLIRNAAGGIPFSRKVATVMGSFEKEDGNQFRTTILNMMKKIIEVHCDQKNASLPFHVLLAMDEMSAGTLRHSLTSVVDFIMVQTLSNVLRALDVNGNLLTHDTSPKLWIFLQKRCMDEDTAIADSAISTELRALPPRNTGRDCVLHAQFPFSYYVMEVHDTLKELLMADGGSKIDFTTLTNTTTQLFGSDFVDLWASFPETTQIDLCKNFMHDLAVAKMPLFVGLAVEVQIQICSIIISAVSEITKTVPLAVSVAFWVCEQQLFSICSLLSKFSPADQSILVSGLTKVPNGQLANAFPRMIMSCVEKKLLSIRQHSELLQWTHEICPSVVIDLKAIGGVQQTEVLDICANFLRDVVVTDPTNNMSKMNTLVPILLEGVTTVSELRGVFEASSIELNSACLVTFVKNVSLPKGEPIEDDILRLICTLKPKLWPVANPLPASARRGLVAALVNRDGFKSVITRAKKLQLGPKFSDMLTGMLHSAIENLSETNTLKESDAQKLIESLNKGASELDYDILRWIVQAKSQISNFCDSVIALKAEQDRLAATTSNQVPKKVQISTATRELLETPYGGLFFLRKLHDLGEWESIKDFLLQTKACNWFLKYDRAYFEKVASDEIPSETAPLITDPQQYAAAAELLKAAAKGGGPAKERLMSAFFPDVHATTGPTFTTEVKLLSLIQARLNGEIQRSWTGKELYSSLMTKLSDNDEFSRIRPTIALMERVGWGPSGSHGTARFKWDARTNTQSIQICCYSLMMQISLMLPAIKGSYLELAATQPQKLQSLFLPAMPICSDVSIVVGAMSEYVTWYKCRNGHFYSIGECGGAMERSTCNHPGCGAVIGGSDHRSAPGNTMVGSSQEVARQMALLKGDTSNPGYHVNSGYSVHRNAGILSKVTAVVLKLLFYASLTIGSFAGTNLLSLNKGLSAKYLHGNFITYWSILSKLTETPHNQLLLLMTELVKRIRPLLESQTAERSFQTAKGMTAFELSIEELINSVFGSSRMIIAQAYKIVGCGTSEASVSVALGQGLVEQMFDPSTFRLWIAKRPVSVESFKKFFALKTSNAAEHPLLASVLSGGDRLEIIEYLADILEWHGIIFRCLQSCYFTRAQAQDLPACELIDRYVPPSEQENARRVLSRYCKVFNKAMPLLPNLYECQRNPFLNREGKVDLGGKDHYERQELSPDAAISFSIPSVLPGEVDATGLCSIQLSGLLHRTHNTVVTNLSKVTDTNTNANSGNNIEAITPPTLSRLSSPDLTKRVLISYKADRDLLPLIFQHRIDFTDGSTGYDLSAIETAIAANVLRGKVPVRLQLSHFQFAGEVRQRGCLSALNNINQVSVLPSSMEEAIRNELDTIEQLSLLLRLLEDVINYVSAIGQHVDANTALSTFIESMCDQGDFESILTPTVAKYGKVEHLKSLFLYVEALLSGGGLLHRVQSKYKQELSDSDSAALRRSVGHLHHSNVVSALRDLLVGALSGNDVNFSETESLKDYIGYQDMDVGNADWFEDHFPEELQLKHAAATYELLVSK